MDSRSETSAIAVVTSAVLDSTYSVQKTMGMGTRASLKRGREPVDEEDPEVVEAALALCLLVEVMRSAAGSHQQQKQANSAGGTTRRRTRGSARLEQGLTLDAPSGREQLDLPVQKRLRLSPSSDYTVIGPTSTTHHHHSQNHPNNHQQTQPHHHHHHQPGYQHQQLPPHHAYGSHHDGRTIYNHDGVYNAHDMDHERPPASLVSRATTSIVPIVLDTNGQEPPSPPPPLASATSTPVPPIEEEHVSLKRSRARPKRMDDYVDLR